MPLPNDPAVEAIAERLRAIVARQPAPLITELADILCVDVGQFRRLIEDGRHAIDVVFLIDTVAAVVHTFAVDPQWLLTGRYDPSIHRHALLLGEDRSPKGAQAVREYVVEQYRRLRDTTLAFVWGPLRQDLTPIDQ